MSDEDLNQGYRTTLTPAQASDLGRTDPNVSVCEPINHLDFVGDEVDDDLGIGSLLASLLAARGREAGTADALDIDPAPLDDPTGYGTDPPDGPADAPVFDAGGQLPAAVSTITNDTGKPIRVLITEQWNALLRDAGLLDTFPADPDTPLRFGAAAVLCAALTLFRAEINARWPGRDRSSDGWIGDLAHQRTKSDHNPNVRGRVDAIDVDKDGVDMAVLIAVAIAHPSINYVIFNGRIYSRSHGFRPRAYTGPNKHDKHGHFSVIQSAGAEVAARAWGVADIPVQRPPSPIESSTRTEAIVKALPTLKRGAKGYDVGTVQALLFARGHFQPDHVDDDFGPATENAVKEFQAGANLTGDGVVGPNTWAALLRVA